MRRGLAIAVGIAAAVAVLAAVVVWSARPPEGPVDVDWDHTRCAHCGMLLSDPAFAGQLHLEDGSVLHFDDPGCLLLALDARDASEVHAAWLHHSGRDAWLPLEQSAFVRVPHSPMGYGLGATAAAEAPDALTATQAKALLANGHRAAGADGPESAP